MKARTLLFLPIFTIALVFPVLANDNKDKEKEKADAAVGTGPWITSVRWVDDGQLVASEAQGLLLRPGKVLKVAASDVTKMDSLGEEETSVWSVLPIGDGKVVASNYKGEMFVHGSGEPQKLDVTARWIRTLEKAPGDGNVLAGTEDGKLVVVSLGDKKETKRIDAHAAAIFDIAVNAAGDTLATCAGDGTIKLWKWPSLETAGSMSYGKEAVWSVLFTADGTKVVSGGAERRVRLWDIAQGKLIMSIATTPDWVTSLVAIPKTNLVVGGCMNGKLVVADTKAMLPVALADGPGSAVWSIALSPSGKQLAISTRKHGIALLNADTWQAAASEVAKRAESEKPPAPEKKK